MTRKTLGYVELVWTCPRCATKNPGSRKFCNGCGAPQPDDVSFEQPEEEKLLTDPKAIAWAKAGPDVHCPYCDARNASGATFCGACGGDLREAKARESGKVLGAHRAEPAAPIGCPNCGTENPASALRCSNCGASLAADRPQAAQPTPKQQSRKNPRTAILVVGALAACGLLALILLLVSGRRSEIEATVASVSWSRSLELEAYGPVEHEGWRDEIPAEASIGVCIMDYRTTSDFPAPQATEVCGTPYTVDTGSGAGEVVQDCVYEIYEERCSFTIQEWSVVDTLTASGSDSDPFWPEISLAAGQRFGELRESFEVVFSADGETFSYRPDGEELFRSFEVGTGWVLEVNGFGAVVSVRASP